MAKLDLNLICAFYTHICWQVHPMENLMPRFYFNLASKDAHIRDDSGKELATLNDAYEHARKLTHKILFHVGDKDVEAWKVIVLNDDHDAQMIIRFSISQRSTPRDWQRKLQNVMLYLGHPEGSRH